MSTNKISRIQLIPLSTEHLELLRNWRNKNHVRAFMDFQDTISIDQQKRWFENLNKRENKYFIFCDSLEPVGLVNLKNITAFTAEAGLFVGNEKFLGTGVAMQASITLLDLAFFKLKLANVTAKVKKENRNARLYNSFLGFRQQAMLNNEFVIMSLTKENYLERRPFIHKEMS
jgi:RimJ/RimL family protein N-acetyltransferase